MDPLNPQPNIVPEVKKTHKVFYIWLGILVLAIIGGVGYWHKNQKEMSVNESNKISAIDDTANWKTYKNDYFGFEFKYPQNWSETGSDQGLYFQDLQKGSIGEEAPTPLMISFEEQKNYEDINAWFDNDKYKEKNYDPILKKEVSIGGGIKALEFNDPTGSPIGVSEYYLIKDRVLIKITLAGTNELTTQQILSTFKFTNTASVDTPNWKNYTNAQYGFSFKIPNDWSAETPTKFDKFTPNLIFISQKNKDARDKCDANYCTGEGMFSNIEFNTRDMSDGDSLIDKSVQKINGIDFTIYHLGGAFDYYIYQAKNNGQMYSFMAPQQDEISNVLSTFKFTDPISDAEQQQMFAAAKVFVSAHSVSGLQFDLKLNRYVVGYALLGVTPTNMNIDPAQVIMQKIDGKWVAQTMGTAFEDWAQKVPELFN